MPISPSFVHLRLHSEFSIVDGITRLDAAVAKAKADGQTALGLSDLGNTFGFVKFYKAARAKGVKPILGSDVFITNPADRDNPFRALLLIQNDKGYKNLCELISKAWLTNVHRDRGEIDFNWFTEHAEGLICLSGTSQGEVGQALLKRTDQGFEEALQAANRYRQVFKGRFFIELQRAGLQDEDVYVRSALQVAAQAQAPVVATHPIQFLNPEDFQSHEARVCIASGETLANSRRKRAFTDQQYLATQADMAERFADIPQALANSVAIAAMCNLSLQLGKPQLPDFPTPNGESLEDYLRTSSKDGLEKRLAVLYPDQALRDERRPTYQARLDLECETIIQMGFPGYFLIVADFINWAKNNNVPVGPGRGSGAGSLVAYSLGITDLDPLPYALLFERFLNPERVSMPDFDIDFCQEKRQRVIDYVRSKYGRQAVSQIVTFGTMASRAVIRDAGRVLELPYNFCDQLSKLIPVVQNKPLSLAEAREKEPILAEREKKEDEVRELLALAEPLEDLTRNVGMHAGGVLIAPGKITDFCPLYQAPGASGEEGVVSMYDKDDVEAVGLVKFDFLGLRNLTIIQLAVDTINRLYPDRPLKLEDLNGFDDPSAYQVLKQANTTAIFQVESQGMKRYLLKLQPDSFEDIIAMLALYRPGPLNSGMVDDFILRKQGQQRINYFHDDLKDCLTPTYGVIVYQEQVMQIAQIMAGYTLGGADLLRRAMGKKKPEEMAQQRSIFLEGAKTKGHSEKLATELFDLMEKFAEYGFNKSHTAAYAVITYQTAWLKAHYPAEFLAATMSSDMDDTDKVAFLVGDAKANGLGVLPPSINASGYRFEPVLGVDEQGQPLDKSAAPQTRARAIRYGLGAVRGVGESAVMSILKAREQGSFKNLFDFCSRIDRRLVNKRAIEALVKSGAFDETYPMDREGRAQLVAAIDMAIRLAETQEANADQAGLFGDIGADNGSGASADATNELAMPNVPPYSARDMLLEEKLALGYCFSGSLFDNVAQEVRRFAATPLARAMPTKDPIWIAGVVTNTRAQMTRRGMMRVVELDDGSGRMEVTVFNELYDARKHVLKVDDVLIVSAKIDNDEYSGGLRGSAMEILTLAEARGRHARSIRLALPADQAAEQFIARLKQLLMQVQGDSAASGSVSRLAAVGCPIVLQVQQGQQVCELRLAELFRFQTSDAMLDQLHSEFGTDNVSLDY
jgi:DNA polymerase III subunit alpha